jgi:hypothetical protein
MKLNQLALAILTATGLLVACSDEPKKPEKGTKTEQAAQTATPAGNTAQPGDLAQQAEDRYRANIELMNTAYQKMYGQHTAWLIKQYQASVSDYQRGDNSATATSKLTFQFGLPLFEGADQPLTLTNKDTITYNKELLDKGIVAHIDTQADTEETGKLLKKILKDNLNTSDTNLDSILTGLSNTKTATDLHTDGSVHVIAETAPFQVQEGDDSLDFKGMKQEFRYNSKTFADGVMAMNLTVEPFTFTATDKKDGDSATVAFSPIKVEYAINEDGTLKLNTSPLKSETTAKEGLFIFEVDGIDANGSGVKFDPALMGYLGDIDYNIKNIHVTYNGDQRPFGDITGKSSTRKNSGDNYDARDEMTWNINGATLKRLVPQIPVEPQSLRISASMENFSAASKQAFLESYIALIAGLNAAQKTSAANMVAGDTINTPAAVANAAPAENQTADTATDANAETAASVPATDGNAETTASAAASDINAETVTSVAASAETATASSTQTAADNEKAAAEYEKIAQEKLQTVLQELVKNKTRLSFGLEGTTDSGKASFTSSVGIRADSTATPEAWQQTFDNPKELQELLRNNLDLHAEARINKKLAEKLELVPLIESQGAAFITIDGEDYVAKLDNDNGTLKINGKPLPF